MFRSVALNVAALFVAATVSSQDSVISIDHLTDQSCLMRILAGSTHAVSIRYNVLANETRGFWIGSNGFAVYSPDGADSTCGDITDENISILIDFRFITGPSLGLPNCL